jgi:murein DD-endopeptidase MepM/ murein hydrolase activator NlpD
MTAKGRRRGRLIPAFIACFYAGVAAGWWMHAAGGRDDAAEARPAQPDPPSTPAATTGQAAVEHSGARQASAPAAAPAVIGETIGADPVAELRRQDLRLPIDEAEVDEMKGDFAERRGGGARGHEAIDILAPRHTPIRAVDDGTIAKLFVSKAGGITIYQFDPTERFCYYYAHLERYAEGLTDRKRVSKGDIIGYVGTTGNAPPNTPHLHFAIYQLTDDKRWWEGRPIDPYLVFKD